MFTIMNSKVLIVFVFVTLSLIHLSLLTSASYWTFYLPDCFKQSGYKELTERIENTQKDIDLFERIHKDVDYFWSLIEPSDDGSDSSCRQVLITFKSLATAYAEIDYQMYMKPRREHLEYLINYRDEIYPEGANQKNVLPKVWEQSLVVQDIEKRLTVHTELTEDETYRRQRRQINDLYSSVKRSLDGSADCVMLRLAWRQIAEDVSEVNLIGNMRAMKATLVTMKQRLSRLLESARNDPSIKKINAELKRVKANRQ